MKMGQLFDNSFTLRYWSLKLSLSLHKQIKSAAFEGQDRYCIISSDWCIISSVVTEPPRKLLRSSLKTSEKFWENYKTSEKFWRTLYENIPRSFHRSSLKTFLKFLLSLENFLGVFNEDLKLPGSFRWSLKTSPKFSGRFENFSEVYGAA